MKRSIREWLTGSARAGETSDTTGDSMTPPARSASAAGVTVGEALGLSLVYRAVQVLAFSGKQLSIDTKRYGRMIEDHQLVRRPDPDISRSSWIEQAIVSLATTGNCYFEIIRDTAGTTVALVVLNPLDVRIRTNREGRVTSYAYQGRKLAPSRVEHITLVSVPGSAYGLGPIQAAQPDLAGAISTRDYAAAWMDDSGVPTGVLKSDQAITPQKAAEAQKNWTENVGHRNGVVVMGSGLDYRPIFLSPKDVQFIESQQFNVTQVARLFGMPPSLMLAAVDGGSQTYQNIEQAWIEYIRFTLMGYLVEIEDALSQHLPGAQRAAFNVEALLRADTTTRYTSYATAIAAGFKTVDEIRAIEGDDPLPATTTAPEANA